MNAQTPTLSTTKFDAVILDMDGVVTRTAEVHAAAWKAIFDSYLETHAEQRDEAFTPFDIESDYLRFVDGKPRHDGIRDFFRSRSIDLPDGEPDDPAGKETVYGLGQRKNRYFQKLIEEQGVSCHADAVTFIKNLKNAGFKIALISASRNAEMILSRAGISHLFDVRVDGQTAADHKLSGKPAPDVFLYAADQLGTTPAKSVVIEDAQAGVKAGRAGQFGLVIGVARKAGNEELSHAADAVVHELTNLKIETAVKTTDSLPSILDRFNDLTCRLKNKKPAVFLDYDGTLTPIVERPELARISDEMHQTVEDLAKVCTVAIVSGRDRLDVQQLAGIEDIYYAGSHGFDISGPAGKKMEFQQGSEYLPALDQAEKALRDHLEKIEGTQIERKKFAIAVHFRRAAAENHDQIEKAVDDVIRQAEGLRKTGGKMIFELRPAIDWDKGKALLWLLQKLDLDRRDILPIYLGDDLTDEDAMRALEKRGLGILVRDETRPTAARYALEDTAEVRIFLRKLYDFLEERDES